LASFWNAASLALTEVLTSSDVEMRLRIGLSEAEDHVPV